MLIFLVGYMGCGKSTLGQQLAQRLDYEFIDLDRYIETKNECTVSSIFKDYGEIIFRKEEHECLVELLEKENTVISVGGGTPCFQDNMTLMNQSGMTFFINTPIAVLFNRLKNKTEQRPLLANKTDEELLNFIQKNHTERLPYYQKAQRTIESENIKIEDLLCFFN